MTDSFFSASNRHDLSLRTFDQVEAQNVMEAASRRIAKLNGPIEAAKVNYRLADICAGANVLPVEHWSPPPAVAPAPPPPPESARSAAERFLARFRWPNLIWVWCAFLLGLWLGHR